MIAGNWHPVIEPSSALGRRATSLLDSITCVAMASPGLDAAVFLAHRALAERNQLWMNRAVQHLNWAIASADTLYSMRRFQLLGGLSGLGWSVEYVARQLNRFQDSPDKGVRAAAALNQDIDEALLGELQRGRWAGTWDLASGITGIGMFFLQGLSDSRAKFGLELVLAHLNAAAKSERPLAEACAMLYLAEAAAEAGVASAEADGLIAWCTQCVLRTQNESWEDELRAVAVLVQKPRTAECAEWIQRALERCLQVRPAQGVARIAHLWSRIYGLSGDLRCQAIALQYWERVIQGCETETAERDADVGIPLSAALTAIDPELDCLLCLWPAASFRRNPARSNRRR